MHSCRKALLRAASVARGAWHPPGFTLDLHRRLLVLVLSLAAGMCHAACDDAADQPGEFPFASEQPVAAFLAKLQDATRHADKEAVADLVRYPVRAMLGEKQVRLDRKRLLAHFDDVFNERVRSAILAARFQSTTDHECVFWNAEGMMLGDGEVWLNSGQDGIRIITVNNS